MNVSEAIPSAGAWAVVASAARTRMRERAAEIGGRVEPTNAEHLGAPARLRWSGTNR